jgi:4-amino-4-deoxy-L-arabinose transferase-like glycosyltransferase
MKNQKFIHQKEYDQKGPLEKKEITLIRLYNLLKRSNKAIVWMIILLFSLGVMIVGLSSNLYLGDEITHYRFAKGIFTEGERITFDPLFGKNYSNQVNYLIPPLWHILLAFLWKIVGRISYPLAQVYHTIYYALLLFSTYLLGKEIYGEEEGKYSMILVGTVPMIISFGILFYVDVPLAALTTLTFFLILRRKQLFAGLGFGLMYFTKWSGVAFGIPFLLAILFLNYKDKFLMKMLFFSLASLMIILPDIYWREKHASKEEYWMGNAQTTLKSFAFGVSHNIKGWVTPKQPPPKGFVEKISYGHNSTFLSIKDHIKYFGLPLLSLLMVYLFKRKFLKKDWLLWMPIFFYFLFFIFFFNINADIRYLLPISPFLCVMASKAIALWDRKKFKILFLVICLVQFLSVLGYVYSQRRITPAIQEGIHYIKKNTSEDAIIIYLEYNLTEYTNRRVVWTSNFWRLEKVFWGDDELTKDLLVKNKVQYVLIKKAKIYDDKERRHLRGYPISFIQRLSTSRFFELKFDNKELSLWRLKD